MKFIHTEDYPLSYEGMLSPEQRIRIVAWFKMKQNRANGCYKNANSYSRENVNYIYFTQEGDKLMKEIDGAVNCLRSIGVMMEYGWVGHREEWFMATAYDAELQDDYLYDCD